MGRLHLQLLCMCLQVMRLEGHVLGLCLCLSLQPQTQNWLILGPVQQFKPNCCLLMFLRECCRLGPFMLLPTQSTVQSRSAAWPSCIKGSCQDAAVVPKLWWACCCHAAVEQLHAVVQRRGGTAAQQTPGTQQHVGTQQPSSLVFTWHTPRACVPGMQMLLHHRERTQGMYTSRQTDRQTDKQTNRQTGKPAHRQTTGRQPGGHA